MAVFCNRILFCCFESKGELMKIICQDEKDQDNSRKEDKIDQF